MLLLAVKSQLSGFRDALKHSVCRVQSILLTFVPIPLIVVWVLIGWAASQGFLFIIYTRKGSKMMLDFRSKYGQVMSWHDNNNKIFNFGYELTPVNLHPELKIFSFTINSNYKHFNGMFCLLVIAKITHTMWP